MHIDWRVKQSESHVEITGGNTPLAENNTTTAKLMWLNLSAKNTARQGGGSEREEEVCKNASTEVDKNLTESPENHSDTVTPTRGDTGHLIHQGN